MLNICYRKNLPCLLLGLCVTAPSPSSAANLYVAKTANASDENPGTKNQPWLTLTVAAQRARAGDTVFVGRGDYRNEDSGYGRGIIPIKRSGTASETIRFIGDSEARPIVYSFLLRDRHHIRIQGFAFKGPSVHDELGWINMPHIFYDSHSATRPDYTQPWETRETQIEQEFATYFELISRLEYVSAVELARCTNIKIIDNVISRYWAGIQSRGSSYITIRQNSIRSCVNGIYSWFPAPGIANSVIGNNVIRQSLDNGIDLRAQSSGVIIQSNLVLYSGIGHISLLGGANNCEVRSNEVAFGGYYSETMQYPGSSAISLHSSSTGNRILNNNVRRQMDLTAIDGNGIAVDSMRDGAQVIVRGNIVWRNAGDGLNTTLSPNNFIAENCFMNNGYQVDEVRRGAGIKFSRWNDVGNTVVDNMFLSNQAAGILSSNTLGKQKKIDRNTYLSLLTPLMWDSFDTSKRYYATLEDVRQNTPWEKNGSAAGPIAW